MTGQERGRQRVEQFFAAHRAQVRDEPADDLTWQRIRDGHRAERSRRRRAWGGGLVAAAAALALVAGPSLLPDAEAPEVAGQTPSESGPTPSETGSVPSQTGPETSPSEDPGLPSATTTAPTSPPTSVGEPRVVTAPVPEGELPADGRVTDVTTADPEPTSDTGVQLAAVMSPCPSRGWCTVLADSADGGITWAPRADLTELGMVHRVLFTDDQRGWVWGDKAPLWTTTDGGTTWTEIPISGDAVEQLEVHDGLLVAVTTSDDPQACTSGDCPVGSRQVLLADLTDTDWRDERVQDLGGIEAAEIRATADVLYVVARERVDGPVTQVLRLQDGSWETTAEVGSCGDGPAAVTGSGRPGTRGVGWETGLVALCDDDRGLTVQSSPNGGRSWTSSDLTVPSFVLGELPPLLASQESGHLVVIGEGNYSVTTDGGESWSAEAFLPGTDGRPERLEVTQFGEIIAYPTPEQASADLAFWRSVDGGQTWEAVPLVR